MKLEMNVDVSFDDFKLMASLSLDAPIAALFGPPGSGKSTMLGMIAGTVSPQRGWIRLGDELLFDAGGGIRVPASQRRIALVGGRLSIYPHRCARDYLQEAHGLCRDRAGKPSVSEVCRFMQIEDLVEVSYGELDYHQRQRIAVAKALLGAPRLLLIDILKDEGFDRPLKALVPFLKSIQDIYGISVIYVSDDLRGILDSSDQLVLMADGQILGAGDTADLVAERLVTGHTPLRGIENILQVTLLAHERAQGCSIGYYYGTQLVLPLAEEFQASAELEVCVRSNDIALSRRLVEGISIQNQIKGRVCTVISSSRHALVQIDCGTTLLAGISLKALSEMQIREGDVVYCLIKAHAFRYVRRAVQKPALFAAQDDLQDPALDADDLMLSTFQRRH